MTVRHLPFFGLFQLNLLTNHDLFLADKQGKVLDSVSTSQKESLKSMVVC